MEAKEEISVLELHYMNEEEERRYHDGMAVLNTVFVTCSVATLFFLLSMAFHFGDMAKDDLIVTVYQRFLPSAKQFVIRLYHFMVFLVFSSILLGIVVREGE